MEKRTDIVVSVKRGSFDLNHNKHLRHHCEQLCDNCRHKFHILSEMFSPILLFGSLFSVHGSKLFPVH